MKCNGKEYPLWGQLVENKDKYIGGTLEDFGDGFDSMMGMPPGSTKITDITLKPNGDDSAFFEIVGEDFGCGFDVAHGGIGGGESGWLTFHGYGGHKFRIKPIESVKDD